MNTPYYHNLPPHSEQYGQPPMNVASVGLGAIAVGETTPRLEGETGFNSLEVAPGNSVALDWTNKPLSVLPDQKKYQELSGVVAVGDELISVVRVTRRGETTPNYALMQIRQRSPAKDTEHRIALPKFLGWLKAGEPTAVGRNTFPALDETVAPEHCVVGLHKGRVVVANPKGHLTNVLVSNGDEQSPFDEMPWWINKKAEDAEAKSLQPTPEFKVSGNTFTIEGRDPVGHLVMKSTDAAGRERKFMVYQSNSEGSRRVSQGREARVVNGKHSARIMKGAELSPQYQYTQDTQLNPVVAKEIDKILDTGAAEAALPESDAFARSYTDEQAEVLLRDFERQITVLPLAHSLDNRLHRLTTSNLSANGVAQFARWGQSPQSALRREVKDLNADLARSDVIPDFTRPVRYGVANHPVLGPYASEVYTKVVDGRPLEWHMARDSAGRVWVERIRFADAQATAYGTDQQIVYSGVLTAKPLEYKNQCDGLPPEWRPPSGHQNYDDITPFLNQLLPIQRYRETAILPRQRLFHASGVSF